MLTSKSNSVSVNFGPGGVDDVLSLSVNTTKCMSYCYIATCVQYRVFSLMMSCCAVLDRAFLDYRLLFLPIRRSRCPGKMFMCDYISLQN